MSYQHYKFHDGIMSQRHGAQHGTFHITINAFERIPWCTLHRTPILIIDNLVLTRNIQKARLHAFCILPNHLHVLLCPGNKGLSAFVQSFKSNCTKDVREHLGKNAALPPQLGRRVPASYKKSELLSLIHWQNGFHDERIRDDRQRSAALAYIQCNGSRHHLVKNAMDWPWTSLHFPHIIDPMDIWLDERFPIVSI